MTSALRYITFNCASPREPFDLAVFWSAVLGCPVRPGDEPGDDVVALEPVLPGGPALMFVRVPDGKGAVRNRVELYMQPRTSRAEEIERLLGLGAVLVSDERRPGGRGRIVLADPVGNEFCVELSQQERDEYDRRTASSPAAWE